MSYFRANKILPVEIIELIQEYVDRENIYMFSMNWPKLFYKFIYGRLMYI